MYIVSCGADTHQGSWSPHSWGLCITRDSPQSVGLLWTSDQLVAETSTWQHTTSTTKTKKFQPNGRLEPTKSKTDWPKTNDLDCTAAMPVISIVFITSYYLLHSSSQLQFIYHDVFFRIVPIAIKFNFFLIYVCDPLTYFSFLWPCFPERGIVSSFLRFVVHTQRRFAVCRTTLSEWSARRRNLYLTTRNSEKKKFFLLAGIEPKKPKPFGLRPTP